MNDQLDYQDYVAWSENNGNSLILMNTLRVRGTWLSVCEDPRLVNVTALDRSSRSLEPSIAWTVIPDMYELTGTNCSSALWRGAATIEVHPLTDNNFVAYFYRETWEVHFDTIFILCLIVSITAYRLFKVCKKFAWWEKA